VLALAVAFACNVPQCTAQNRHPQQQYHTQPQRHAGQWLQQHRNLPPAAQQKALENDPAFRNLPPQRQQELRNRLQHFNSLPPEQQNRVLNRMETWEHLTPQQKNQARTLHNQMQALPQDRRQAVGNAVQTLRAMPPAARDRTIDSDAYKARFSPEERDMLKNASQLPLAPTEPAGEAR
jgi:hypothetical protein